MSEQDVLDKLDDVLDELSDSKEKLAKIELTVENHLRKKLQVAKLCPQCNGSGVVEEDACPTCSGERVVDFNLVYP